MLNSVTKTFMKRFHLCGIRLHLVIGVGQDLGRNREETGKKPGRNREGTGKEPGRNWERARR
jgi:hypothetical protein